MFQTLNDVFQTLLANKADVTKILLFLTHKVKMVQAKMNRYLNIPVYSLISLSNIKDENKVNNQ